MVTVLLAVGILLIVVGLIGAIREDDFENLWGVLFWFGITIACVSLIWGAIEIGIIGKSLVIDQKIAMYEEENAKIEAQINDLVSSYMDFEKETYGNFKAESSVTLVSLFPELKSDQLVQKQLEVYVSNNAEIKSLKEDKIDISMSKWRLYFGH